MKKLLIFFLFVLVFNACSLQPPVNKWQYQSTHAYQSYQNNFLSGNDIMAKSDLKQAIKYAKQSADLHQLSKIYLGKCALNISVGINDSCSQYKKIAFAVNDKNLDAYSAFIRGDILLEDVILLPKSNQKFVHSLLSKNYTEANNIVLETQKMTSQILYSSLLKDKLETKVLKKLINKASYYGYKRVALFLLTQLKERAKDAYSIRRLEEKISILNTK